MSDDNFDAQIELANKSCNEQKKVRNELNAKVGKIIEERNQFNRRVRELIAEVQKNKKIRDQANLEVKTNKQFRAKKNDQVKSAKASNVPEEDEEQWKRLINAQNEAHEKVKDSATRAQAAHDLMLKISKEVDAFREKADDCQKQLRRIKREADRAHQQYIVSRRVLHSMKDIIRARENPEEVVEVVEEVEELVELEPLTDEQIKTVKEIIMEYYETSNPNLDDTARKHSELIDSIEYELVPGEHRVKILSPRVGILIGRKGAIIRPLQEKILEHFPHIHIVLEQIEKSKDHSKNHKPKGYTEYNFGEEE